MANSKDRSTSEDCIHYSEWNIMVHIKTEIPVNVQPLPESAKNIKIISDIGSQLNFDSHIVVFQHLT